jgi:metallo-beta-lactamase family protein
VRVRAQIRQIDSYSAHADRDELADWIAARLPVAGSVFLDHGEPEAAEGLRRLLQTRMPDQEVRLPVIGERYALPPGGKAKRETTGRQDLPLETGRDWQNAYADFASSLKARLAHMPDDREREQAMRALREVLDAHDARR